MVGAGAWGAGVAGASRGVRLRGTRRAGVRHFSRTCVGPERSASSASQATKHRGCAMPAGRIGARRPLAALASGPVLMRSLEGLARLRHAGDDPARPNKTQQATSRVATPRGESKHQARGSRLSVKDVGQTLRRHGQERLGIRRSAASWDVPIGGGACHLATDNRRWASCRRRRSPAHHGATTSHRCRCRARGWHCPHLPLAWRAWPGAVGWPTSPSKRRAAR